MQPPPPPPERESIWKELNFNPDCLALQATTPTGRKWLLQQLISLLFQVIDVAASVIKSSFVQVFDAEVHLADVEGEAADEGDGCEPRHSGFRARLGHLGQRELRRAEAEQPPAGNLRKNRRDSKQ